MRQNENTFLFLWKYLCLEYIIVIYWKRLKIPTEVLVVILSRIRPKSKYSSCSSKYFPCKSDKILFCWCGSNAEIPKYVSAVSRQSVGESCRAGGCRTVSCRVVCFVSRANTRPLTSSKPEAVMRGAASGLPSAPSNIT